MKTNTKWFFDILSRLWLEWLLFFDFCRGFFEPFMAYRIGYLVIVKRRCRRPWPTVLSDGTVVKRGDKIVRIHMKVFLPRFRGDNSELSYTRYLYELLVPELPKLANLLRYDPAWQDYVAIFGQSHIIGRFTEKAGFETRDIPDWWKIVVDLLGRGAMLSSDPSLRCLKKILRPDGVRPPRECWAGRDSFLRRYPVENPEVPELRRLFRYF